MGQGRPNMSHLLAAAAGDVAPLNGVDADVLVATAAATGACMGATGVAGLDLDLKLERRFESKFPLQLAESVKRCPPFRYDLGKRSPAPSLGVWATTTVFS